MLILLLLAVATSVVAQEREIVLIGGTLLNSTGSPIKNAVVVIQGNRIASVGSGRKIKYQKSARIIDTRGKYLLPGLIDIHVHYNDWMGEMFLAHGVTTVKDVGNYVEWISVVSDAVESGKVRGPRIFYTGNGLDTPPPKRDHFIGLESPQMAARAVQLLHQRGAIAVKVREKVPLEILKSIVHQAHQLNLRVTGHVRRVNAYEAALAGIDGLEHASGIVQATIDNTQKLDLDSIADDYQRYVAERKSYALINPAKAERLVKFLATKKVALIPTMAGWWRMATPRREEFATEDAVYAKNATLSYVPLETRQIWETSALYELKADEDLAQVGIGYKHVQTLLRQHHQAGGKVLAGSDTFISVPGLSLLRELIFFVDAGFSPMQAIGMATRENAEFLGKGTELGSITAGKLADILIVDANPLTDIRNLKRVAMVFKNGQLQDLTYHADYSITNPRPKLMRPLWLEKQLKASPKTELNQP